MTIADIIIPVYRGIEEVRRCVESVLRYEQKTRYEIILVDDNSPEKAVSEYLARLSQRDKRITCLHNEQNMGFVASVNRGMMYHEDRDVVLLNSDTEVTEDWLDRLVTCAYSDGNAGTVSPFSNNATLCSFPKFFSDNRLPDNWSTEALDRIFARVNQGKSVGIPTSVGFCMFIRRACIESVGLFDVRTFGRGYGEENDFCMRAAKRGWRHLLCADTFVFHQGGVSFGKTQEARQKNAMEKLRRLHPEYAGLVQQHVDADPARPFRMAVLLEMFRSSPRKKILFISHNIGGGCERHVQELAAMFRDSMDIITGRSSASGGITVRMGAETDAEMLHFPFPDNYHEFLDLCRYIGISRIHYHHITGFHPAILNLPADLAVPYDITLHDYYFIQANPTLTDRSGVFHTDRAVRNHAPSRIPRNLTPAAWQVIHGSFLQKAARVISPSGYTAKIYREYFPELNPVKAPHPDHKTKYPDPRLTIIRKNEPMRIAAIGALNREKGADILEKCALLARKDGHDLEFYLIGPAYRPLNPAVITSGRYQDSDLQEIIRRINPHIIWFPALWPETWSYTLSAALESGRPLVVPDIGAFPERVCNRPLTWIEPCPRKPMLRVLFFRLLQERMLEADYVCRYPWPETPEPDFLYTKDYPVQGEDRRPAEMEPPDTEWIRKFACQKTSHSLKESLLIRLLRLRTNPLVAGILQFIPYDIQRNIKRQFSEKPIHELFR